MANRRLSVSNVKEILRLKHSCGLSRRDIAQKCNVAPSTVGDYLRRAREAGVSWPEAAQLHEAELEARLFRAEHVPSSTHHSPPKCGCTIHDQLRFCLRVAKQCPEYDGYEAGIVLKNSTGGLEFREHVKNHYL